MIRLLVRRAKRSAEIKTKAKGVSWSMYKGVPANCLTSAQRQERRALLACGFLFAAYKPEYWYFEVIECCRKLALSSVVLFVEPQSIHQIMFACMVNFVMVLLYAAMRPCASNVTHGLKMSFTILLFMDFFIGLVLHSGAITKHSTIWMGILVGMNMFLIFIPTFVGCVLVFYAVRQTRKRKNHKDEEHEDEAEAEETEFLME